MSSLGWRSHCRSVDASDPGRSTRNQESIPDYEMKCLELLKSAAFRKPSPSCSGKTPAYVAWLLSRVRKVNSLGGPRVRVVWWSTLAQLRELPRYPDRGHLILDLQLLLEKWLELADSQGLVDNKAIAVIFNSHRWERPHWCGLCSEGNPCTEQAHPDTKDHYKARSIASLGKAQYLRGDTFQGRGSGDDSYHWIDFSCIDQEDSVEKLYGIKALPLYISITEQLNLFYNNEYPNRAWTSLERYIAYFLSSFNMFVGYDMSLDYSQGTIPLDSSAVLDLVIADPVQGHATVEADLAQIARLKEIVGALPPIEGMHVDGNVTRQELSPNQTKIKVYFFRARGQKSRFES